jgi:hypothetical protein
MSLHEVSLGKIAIVGVLAGLLLASRLFERGARRERWFEAAFGVVGLLAVLAYFNFGHLRGQRRIVHAHEQYHFYLGSKYLEEIRYDGIYQASALAAQERGENVAAVQVRDPMTFQLAEARNALEHAPAVKARFEPARWAEFTADVAAFESPLGLSRRGVWRDHGNTGSPAWAAVAYVFTAPTTVGPAVARGLALLDVALLAVLFVTMARCFSPRTAAVGLVVAMVAPRAFDWLGGSILRLDWLFAIGMCACFLKARRWKTAGAFLGYAIASKPFCALMALALGASFVAEVLRRRRLPAGPVSLVAAATAALLASVAVSAFLFGGLDIWGDYFQRLLVTLNERYYDGNHSFRDVFLQVRAFGLRQVLDWTPDHVAASLPSVREDFLASFLVARLLLGALVLGVAARQDEVGALSLGVLLVFVVFVTNVYYWQMLLLPAVALADGYRRGWRRLALLLFLVAFLMASYLFIQLDDRVHLQGYFGSCWLTVLCLLVPAIDLLGASRTARKGHVAMA